MSELGSVVELLQELVRIPSVNPDGEPGTDQIGEQACADFVCELLQDSGAEAVQEEVLPGRPNVIGRFPTNGEDKPVLIFGPHLDTVGVGGMTIDPFGAEIHDGRIWGRGTSDTKGSMATMLWALRAMRDRIPDLDTEIWFVGFMSEESSQFGSQHFGKKYGNQVDFAVVGEPTMLDVVHAHKACWWLEISTHGKAAHASRPELGENAILKMTHVLQALDGGFRATLDQWEDEVLGKPTISLDMCRGGTRANIVPDSCVATMDIRATPALFRKGVVETVREFLDSEGFADADLNIVGSSPTLSTDPANPFIQKMQSCGSALTHAPWFCDAGWLAEAGIPGVAIGPGSIDQAHTKDEWIRIEDLKAGADYFRRFIQTL